MQDFCVPRTLETLRISASIRQYRKERSLSQKQLAKLCEVDQSQISRFESGRFSRAGTNLKKVCRYADIPVTVEPTIDVDPEIFSRAVEALSAALSTRERRNKIVE